MEKLFKLRKLGLAHVDDLRWRNGWGLFSPMDPQKNDRSKITELDELSPETVNSRPYLSDKGKRKFLLECWNVQIPDNDWQKYLDRYEAYFQHYAEACRNVPDPLLECSHQHFCEVVSKLVKDDRASCEAGVNKCLPNASQNAIAVRTCIHFVGAAILMLDLSDWRMDETLEDFISRHVGSRSSQEDRYRIPLSFNARTIAYKAGIKVSWDSNLLSHLDVGLERSCLKIFHHNAVLNLYECSGNRFDGLFPNDFIAETRRTMWLLLPQADKSCMSWFKVQHSKYPLGFGPSDVQHMSASERNIQNFDFWRDRLIEAKDAFDNHQPGKFLQFWRDDRNKTQWYTFWIALLVSLLTVFSLVTSILQVYEAYNPNQPFLISLTQNQIHALSPSRQDYDTQVYLMLCVAKRCVSGLGSHPIESQIQSPT